MTAQQMYANPSALGDLIEARIAPTSYVCSSLQLILGVALPTGLDTQTITSSQGESMKSGG